MSLFGSPVVSYGRSHIEELRRIKPVFEAFAKKIGKSITVENPHGQPMEQFHGLLYGLCVYFWSLPRESHSVNYARAYRYELQDSQRDGIRLSEGQAKEGVKIIDTNGQAIALIVGKTLYILFDLPHSDGTCPHRILELILDDYYLFLTDRAGFDKEMERRVVELPKELFVNVFKNALDNHDGNVVEEVESRISELRRDLSLAVRDRRVIFESKKTPAEVKLQDDNEKIVTMYQRLCNISTTGKITVSGNEVMVPVGQIDIVYDGVTYDIGEFEVGIDLDDCKIKCYNKTRQIKDQHHPHVSSSGDACLGDASYGLGLLLGDLELETVVYMMVEFLRSYNKNGCYQNIESWPVKGTKEFQNEPQD